MLPDALMQHDDSTPTDMKERSNREVEKYRAVGLNQ